MNGEMLGMIMKMRKLVTFTTLGCYRSVSSHPFLVGMLCFLVFLYRWSPFVFSLLVSASPVLICTAVVLGTLLSFGQPNLPEIERDEKTSHDIVSLKTGVSEDAIVIEKNENYSVQKFNEKRGVVIGQLNGAASSIANRTIDLHRGGSIGSSAPFIKEMHRDLELDDTVVAEEATKIHDSGYVQKNDISDERFGYGDTKTDDEDLEMANDKSPAESFDSERVNVDSLDSPPGSPWKHSEEREEQEDQDAEDDEDTDSGSDRAESSSPDASMADIMPMLDELHPLLDEDAPHPVALSHDGSDAASECSLKSSDSSSDSDDNMEKDEQVEVADEDNEDADDEDEGQGNQDGQTKSAITWTEEDQKNLLDLGTSELERNQRLESLIARRRARKTMSLMAERNLIDLESADLPFSIAPISTARNNPFDLPHDSYDDSGLPPIPGSAPSILLARRNPFDLPYDSSEEKPDLLGDSFQQEFTAALPREPFFRRHESFSVGPSLFGSSRQERQDGRLRPYFVVERMDSEGTGYSSLQRQSSGLSDSKASSVLETDSVASAGDNEKNLLDENISHSTEPLNSVPEMELRDSAEDLDNRVVSEEDICHDVDDISMKEINSSSEVDISQEQEHISNIQHVSEHVGHGSQTSEETDSLELGEIEKRDAEANKSETGYQHMENDNGAKPFLFEEECCSSSVKLNVTETNSSGEGAEQVYRSTSSSSSLSGSSERIFSKWEGEGLSNLEGRSNPIIEYAGIPIQPSHEGSHFNMIGDTPQKEPVYDSSPPAFRKDLSLSSISSDSHVESDTQPILIKRTVSFSERELESGQEIERNISSEMDGPELMLRPVDESESTSMMSIEASDNDIMRFNISGADQGSNNASGTLVSESVVNNPASDAKSSQNDAVEGDLTYHGSEYLTDQSFPLVDTDVHLAVNSVLPPIVDSMVRSGQSLTLSQAPSSSSTEEVLSVNMPHTGIQSLAEYSVDKEVALQPELGREPSLISDTNVVDDVPVEPEEKRTSAQNEYASEERPVAEYGEELVFLDKSVDEGSSTGEHHGEQNSSAMHEGMINELNSNENLNMSVAQELEEDVLPSANTPASPESISILSEAYENRAAEGYSDVESNSVHEFGNEHHLLEGIKFAAEATNSLAEVQNIDDDADEIKEIGENIDDDADEMKEIDEALLSELDAVGDFSIKEPGSSSHELENLVASVEEGSPKSRAILPSNVVDVNPEMQEVEAQSIENVVVMFNKSELTSVKMENMLGSSDILQPGQVDEASISELPMLTSVVNEKPETSKPFSAQVAIEEATSLESMCHQQYDSSSLTEPKMEFPIPEARPLEGANLDYKKSLEGNSQSFILPNSNNVGLHVEEIKNLDQTSSELPVVETRYLDGHSHALKQTSESHEDKLLQSNLVDQSPEFEENKAHSMRFMQSNATEPGLHDLSKSDDKNMDAEVENPEN